MDEKSLYAHILNLSAPWQVQSLSLDEKSGSVTVIVGIAEHTQLTCPTCGKSCAIHDHRRRKWRHLDTCQFTTQVEVMYADDVIVHCRSLDASRSLMQEIDQRLSECGLTLHPEKTKVVYCKDRSRKADNPVISFDFLGYRFQPRCAQRRDGSLFLNFLPAVSTKAAKTMRGRIRSWKIHRWTQLTIKELANSFNPVLRGWINYYGKFYKSKLVPIFDQLNYSLIRWARRKYKRLGSVSQATTWLRRVVAQLPRLFAHWTITHAGMAGR